MREERPLITLEDDAPPLVRILGASLRRSAARPEMARRIRRLRGRVALRSAVGPQAATIHFARGNVHVTHGVARDAGVVIRADLETMGRPGAPKPKVTGALRHPLFAFTLGKVLESGSPADWRIAVDDLWGWADGRDGRPQLLRVVCTDDGTEHVAGAPGGTRVEVLGPAWALRGVFSGDDHFGAAVLEGRVQAVAELPELSRFVGLLTHFMLGDEEAP